MYIEPGTSTGWIRIWRANLTWSEKRAKRHHFWPTFFVFKTIFHPIRALEIIYIINGVLFDSKACISPRWNVHQSTIIFLHHLTIFSFIHWRITPPIHPQLIYLYPLLFHSQINYWICVVLNPWCSNFNTS